MNDNIIFDNTEPVNLYVSKKHYEDLQITIENVNRIIKTCKGLFSIKPGKYIYISNHIPVNKDNILLYYREYSDLYFKRKQTGNLYSFFLIDVEDKDGLTVISHHIEQSWQISAENKYNNLIIEYKNSYLYNNLYNDKLYERLMDYWKDFINRRYHEKCKIHQYTNLINPEFDNIICHYNEPNKYMKYVYLSKLGVINVVDFKFPESKKFVYCTKDDNGDINSRYISFIPATGSLYNPAYEINGKYISDIPFNHNGTDIMASTIFKSNGCQEHYNEEDFIDITSLIKEHNKKYKNEN